MTCGVPVEVTSSAVTLSNWLVQEPITTTSKLIVHGLPLTMFRSAWYRPLARLPTTSDEEVQRQVERSRQFRNHAHPQPHDPFPRRQVADQAQVIDHQFHHAGRVMGVLHQFHQRHRLAVDVGKPGL